MFLLSLYKHVNAIDNPFYLLSKCSRYLNLTCKSIIFYSQKYVNCLQLSHFIPFETIPFLNTLNKVLHINWFYTNFYCSTLRLFYTSQINRYLCYMKTYGNANYSGKLDTYQNIIMNKTYVTINHSNNIFIKSHNWEIIW